MYDRVKCKLCGACLVGCTNNDYDKETAVEETMKQPGIRFFIDNLADTVRREIIFFHSGCWFSLARAKEYGIEAPFRPVHCRLALGEELPELQVINSLI